MDIKLDNILVANNGNLKLCDFGLSTFATSLISKKLGTQAYMAPEIHYARTTPCVAKCTDIFSLGILFFIMTFGAPPFHSAQPQDTYFKFLKMKPGSTDFFKFHPHTRVLYREGLIDENL
jgi:eukaryotic-like serine/threonine-protein kinase